MTTRTRPLHSGSAPAISRVARSPRDDIEGVARIVATCYLEIRDGHRGIHCLRRHVTPTVADHIGVVAQRKGRVGGRPTELVRTVWSHRQGRVDACVIVRRGRRVSVVAMRMEIRGGRWLVTELSTPEDAMATTGVRPLRGTS